MSNLTPEQIMALKVGDIIEVPSLLGKLTTESTILQVDKTTEDFMWFRVLIFGVKLGFATFTLKKGVPTWTFKPV